VTFGFPNSKKNSFRGNYMRKYGISISWSKMTSLKMTSLKMTSLKMTPKNWSSEDKNQTLITVNRNEISATKTVWHEILLRHMIFAYHWTS
jgi:hypothetical protein